MCGQVVSVMAKVGVRGERAQGPARGDWRAVACARKAGELAECSVTQRKKQTPDANGCGSKVCTALNGHKIRKQRENAGDDCERGDK